MLSLPGLYLQKLTTNEPDKKQLEVAIAALKAVLPGNNTPYFEGLCDLDGEPLKEEPADETPADKEETENEPSAEGTDKLREDPA